MKKILIVLAFFANLANATEIIIPCYQTDKQEIFVATSEEEVYKLYDQMLDSARVSNKFLSPSGGMRNDHFSIGFFYEINNKDTLMKFVQRCDMQFIHCRQCCVMTILNLIE